MANHFHINDNDNHGLLIEYDDVYKFKNKKTKQLCCK